MAGSRFRDVRFRAATEDGARVLRDEADQQLLAEWITRTRLQQAQIDRDVAAGRCYVLVGDDVVHTLDCRRVAHLLDRHGLVSAWIAGTIPREPAVPELYHRHEVLDYFDDWFLCEVCEPELGAGASADPHSGRSASACSPAG